MTDLEGGFWGKKVTSSVKNRKAEKLKGREGKERKEEEEAGKKRKKKKKKEEEKEKNEGGDEEEEEEKGGPGKEDRKEV